MGRKNPTEKNGGGLKAEGRGLPPPSTLSFHRIGEVPYICPFQIMDTPQQHTVCQEPVYQKLFFAHARHVRNFLYYKGAGSAEAEDLMQEAFLRLWRECDKVPADKAKSFLFRVANNLYLDAKKHEKVVIRFQQKSPNLDLESEDPHFLLEAQELQARLESAIAQLPEKQREVFLMNRIDKMTYTEIAERLELSVKAVEKRMSQALVEMRKVLKGV